jgi:hypothetical protein
MKISLTIIPIIVAFTLGVSFYYCAALMSDWEENS